MYLDTSTPATPMYLLKKILYPSTVAFCSQAQSQGSLNEILSSNDPELQTTEVVL